MQEKLCTVVSVHLYTRSDFSEDIQTAELVMNNEWYCSSRKQRVIFKRIRAIQSILYNYIWKETTSKPVSEILLNNHLLCETIVVMKTLFANTPAILIKAKLPVLCNSSISLCLFCFYSDTILLLISEIINLVMSLQTHQVRCRIQSKSIWLTNLKRRRVSQLSELMCCITLLSHRLTATGADEKCHVFLWGYPHPISLGRKSLFIQSMILK